MIERKIYKEIETVKERNRKKGKERKIREGRYIKESVKYQGGVKAEKRRGEDTERERERICVLERDYVYLRECMCVEGEREKVCVRERVKNKERYEKQREIE